MAKRKKKNYKKKKDDSPDDASECESLDKSSSAKKVAAASSTSQLEDEVEQVSSFTRLFLTSGKSGAASSHYLCHYCDFSAETKEFLVSHVRQHMTKCPHCCFSSLSRAEVSSHCKYEHDKDLEPVAQEVDSSSTECEMDKDPCSSCVFCSFMSYSTEHLEKHTTHKHPGMLPKSVAKMVTKQVSTVIRRDDAIFYLSITNEGFAKSSSVGLGYNLGDTANTVSSNTIVIDNSEDVKPEVISSAGIRPVHHSDLDSVSAKLMSGSHSGKSLGKVIESKDKVSNVETSSKVLAPVKVETMYCLTCPYSNVYIEKLKCHTIVQHPVGAAAAAYNSNSESAHSQDITFFCVREDCNHSSSDCSAYEKHLMRCCADKKTLKVLERERLKSTVTYILEHHKKYKVVTEESFLNFASVLVDSSLPSGQVRTSPFTTVKSQVSEQSKQERSLNSSHNVPAITSETMSHHSAATEKLAFMACKGQQPVLAISSSSHQLSEANSLNFHQQVQYVGVSSYSCGNSLVENVQSQAHNATGLPSDEHLSQTNQVHSTRPGIYGQNQSSYQEAASTQLHVRSYHDTPQITANWHQNPEGVVNSTTVPNQQEQNYRSTFQNQHLQTRTEFVSQDNITDTAFIPNKSDSFSMIHNAGINPNFILATLPTAPFNQVTVDSVSSSNVNANSNQVMPGVMNQAHTVTNNSTFYEHQQPSMFNTSAVDISEAEIQPQPKMLDLLSDSYSILLSEEFESQGQNQELAASSHSHPHLISLQPGSSYHQTAAASNIHNPSVKPHTPQTLQQSAVVDQQTAVYQSMQHKEPILNQPVMGVSVMQACENQFSFPHSSHMVHMTSNVTNHNPSSSFQTAQSSSSYGALHETLPHEEPSYVQPAPLQSSSVPNFLVSSTSIAPETAQTQPHVTSSSFLQTVESMAPAPIPSTPPRSANVGKKFSGSSPLSPSIYLSGQVPRHKRSSWTAADMRPRGMAVSATPPRNIYPPAPSSGSPSFANQRPVLQGGRGFIRAPRMMSAKGRMPMQRMPHNIAGDDDDVILTAVTRVVPRPDKQQMSGKFTNHMAPHQMLRGRGPVLSASTRPRNLAPMASRRLYPVPPPPAAPLPLPPAQKQFDISKHFEDLACVVNASADEEGMGDFDNDIEIVGVTPGKDAEKGNQPKAVDASKFSFCCVHCGKDQGSKHVMKQHMKARHNDSLLGAFTNIETGQLLFFCPQASCEFMTYEEKRLSEHLSKCFDLDKTKPFDFGTAIKNLKSLKLWQLDVRTFGKSCEHPIDLDGQGMKDNFSSSLNDAFGDIVVSSSGRHVVKPSTLPPQRHQLPHSRPQPSLPGGGATRPRLPFNNNQPQSHVGTRLRAPNLSEQGRMAMRLTRPSFPNPRQQYVEGQRSFRQTRPGLPIEVQNVRGMRPRGLVPMGHHQSPVRRAPPSYLSTPPKLHTAGSQKDPVIIVLDADSPEQPQIEEQNSPIVNNNNVQVSNEIPSFSSDVNSGLESTAEQSQHMQSANVNNVFTAQERSILASQEINDDHQLKAHDSDSNRTATKSSQIGSEFAPHSSNTVVESVTTDLETMANRQETQHRDEHGINSTRQDKFSFAYKNTNVEKAHTVHNNNTLASNKFTWSDTENSRSRTLPDCSTVGSKISRSNLSNSFDTFQSAGHSAATTSVQFESHVNPEFATEYLDEEEKVQEVALEKVFAKVPNMPKNLSHRLVAKFKEYAKYRGVKITTDSKVIDEFVSKIYYQGSSADKSSSIKKSVIQPSLAQNDGGTVSSTVTSQSDSFVAASVPSSNSVNIEKCTTHEAEGDCESLGTPSLKSVQQAAVDEQDEISESMQEASFPTEMAAAKVILAERNLQFSGTFANIAFKTMVTSSQSGQEQVPSDNLTPEQSQEATLSLDAVQELNPDASSSESDNQISKRADTLPVTSSSPACHNNALSAAKSLDEHLDDKNGSEDTAYKSTESSCNRMSPVSGSDNLSEMDIVPQSPHKRSMQIEENSATTASLKEPILITSSVDHIVEGHPALEVDIAGTPFKEEHLPQNREFEKECSIADEVIERENNTEISSKETCPTFGKVAATHFSIIDKSTGKLLFKKTKRGRPRKLPVCAKEKDEENKDVTSEEHFIRRSLRCRKPVHMDYQSEANKIDELMSDDDDEYLIEEDYDSDTDNEWPANTEQPPKKKMRKPVDPPDPTAFEASIKGKFRCWQCKKILTKCSFAKSHIVSKHPDAGLCAIYLDECEEKQTLCLLLFCPRACKYSTTNLEGMKSHMESCSKPLLQDGDKFVEGTKQFLQNKYSELQNMGLEAALNITKPRKPKDPTKAQKPKKQKLKMVRPDMAAITIPHSEAFVPVSVDNEVTSSSSTGSQTPYCMSISRPEQAQWTSHSIIRSEQEKSHLKFPQEAKQHRVTSSYVPGQTLSASSSQPTSTRPVHKISLSEQQTASSFAYKPNMAEDADDILYISDS